MSNYFLQNNCKEQKIIINLVYFVICTEYESGKNGNHVPAFHTIWPSYLLAYMQPYLSYKIAT